MFIVLSKFTVANNGQMVAAVKQAFVNRPRLVEEAPGFHKLEVLSPIDKPEQIWLLTYWSDESSFKQWYGTHKYKAAHHAIPNGLTLIPDETEMQFFEHVSS